MVKEVNLYNTVRECINTCNEIEQSRSSDQVGVCRAYQGSRPKIDPWLLRPWPAR